jgi:hypothetical protein
MKERFKEQLLYEIGDPNNYLSPDVTVSFLSLQVERTEKPGASQRRARPFTDLILQSERFVSGWVLGAGHVDDFGRNAVAKRVVPAA